MLTDKKLLFVGIFGTAIAAVAWLTPLLFDALQALGLATSRAGIDNFAAPATLLLFGLTTYALAHSGRLKLRYLGCCDVPVPDELRIPPAATKDSVSNRLATAPAASGFTTAAPPHAVV